MPELITHSCAALVVWNFFLKRLPVLLVVIGTLLPDLCSRPFTILFAHSEMRTFFPVFHEPIPITLICFLLSRLFIPSKRNEAWLALCLGAYVHEGLDLLQKAVAESYYPLFPFSMWSPRWGILHSEATLPYLPLIILVTWGLLSVARRSNRNA
ncbi:MAG: hypothetical protein HY537_07555 [Deltaproteobacteria bacterium]|nr:hypothetical protein [Deltaproteobacteria bacterium]